MKQTRQQQKENTRKHILDKSYALFASDGFAAPTKEIAKAAGVSEGSIFAHFGTLENLITTVVEQFGRQLTWQLHAMAESQGSIGGFLRTHLDVLSAHEAFYARLVEEQAQLPKDAQVAFLCMQSGVSHHLEALIQNDTGIKDIPLHIIFNSWMGLVHYYLVNRRMFCSDPAGAVLEKHRDVLVDNFITMITP